MKIWWQSSTPIHRLDDYRNTLTKNLNDLKRPDVEVHVNGVDDGSMDLHYNSVVAVNNFGAGGVLNKIMQANEQGYDAVAIGCFLDPAMQEHSARTSQVCTRPSLACTQLLSLSSVPIALT